METVFILMLGLLFLLAISDLIVGVSNDAVNFLNSAIGSKAAPIRVILIVAAAGVLAGATFSDGMMEVARKGIFHPGQFAFKEIMIIFLAVMLTDVILLDIFNTLGLPTSTTVSIVFELLGAAVGIALIKINVNEGSISDMVNYINSGKALAIISGILLSVIVAFSVGAFVQWLTRLLFSFNYTHSIKYFGGFFGGLAITAITYFILIKGLKGSSFASDVVSELPLSDWSDFLAKQDWDGFKALIKALGKTAEGSDLWQWGKTLGNYNDKTYQTGIAEFVSWSNGEANSSLSVPLLFSHYVKYYTFQILLISFAATGLIMQLLHSVFKVNILKVIVIIGTFALAMAFAGNDLVNFIGVPLAGLASFSKFTADDQMLDMDNFMMDALKTKEPTDILFLLIAGLIMVITLWLSKKAKSVVKTTLNLSDQDAVNERFESSGIARGMVRSAVNFNKGLTKIVPKSIINSVNKRFDSTAFRTQDNKDAGVSFDLVRASVNLVVASILIAIGTSLKLPLSTTYVTFMVAMGTSLADGAWDRESAVYRITGVITVIGGWFFTALSAFTVAFLVALILHITWFWGVFIMAALALFVIYRTQIIHKKKTQAEKDEAETLLIDSEDANDIYDGCSNNVASLLIAAAKSYENVTTALGKEKRKALKEALKTVSKLDEESKKLKKNVPKTISLLGDEYIESGHHYVEVIDYVREAMHCLYYIAQPAFKHVDNNHKPLTEKQEETLNSVNPLLSNYINVVVKSISESNYSDSQAIIDLAAETSTSITKLRKKHLKTIKKEPGSTRTNLLYLDTLNETKNLILNINNVYKAFRDFSEENKQIRSRTSIM